MEEIEIGILVLSILQAAVRSGTPILFTCIGEIFAERSGNLNVGLEGLMLVGAIAGFSASFATGHAVVGILAAALAGAVLATIHAFVTYHLSERGQEIVEDKGFVPVTSY